MAQTLAKLNKLAVDNDFDLIKANYSKSQNTVTLTIMSAGKTYNVALPNLTRVYKMRIEDGEENPIEYAVEGQFKNGRKWRLSTVHLIGSPRGTYFMVVEVSDRGYFRRYLEEVNDSRGILMRMYKFFTRT